MELSFPYTIRSSKRAKNIRINISNSGKVTITKPWLAPDFIVKKFVIEKKDWITQTLDKINSNKINQNKIWYLGNSYIYKFTQAKLSIVFQKPYLNISAYTESAAKRELKKKFIKEAKHAIHSAVTIFSKKMNLDYNSIRFKDQSTRWGSCSSQNNLNFNWRLIMAPPSVLQYVIIHELAHLKHMDHSYKFWELVEKYDVDFREHRRWLKKHQQDLQFNFDAE